MFPSHDRGNPAEALVNERDGEWERRWKKDRKGSWQATARVADDGMIRKAWTLGFTQFEWASSATAAVYLCKYISKAMHVRVRASAGYGRIGMERGSRNRPSPEEEMSKAKREIDPPRDRKSEAD